MIGSAVCADPLGRPLDFFGLWTTGSHIGSRESAYELGAFDSRAELNSAPVYGVWN
jgi:hypothetical protein